MSKVSFRLNHDFLSVLTLSDFDNFTVLEFRAAYMAQPSCTSLDKTRAQRIVYSLLTRLQKNGLLKRTESKTAKKIRYQKTELFYSVQLLPHSAGTKLAGAELNDAQIEAQDQLRKQLVEKLKQYELELLTSMGESDEYKALYSEFPQLKSQLQERYNQARDNSSKLLGRVKALETLIKQQKGLSSL